MLKQIIHSTDSPVAVEAGMAACRTRIRIVIRTMAVLMVVLITGLVARVRNPQLLGSWGERLFGGVLALIIVQAIEWIVQRQRLTKLLRILNFRKNGSMQ